MLADSQVATRLPVNNLERARRFYSEKLGLEPAEERPGGLCYRCGSGYFALFESAGAASGYSHSDGLGGGRHRGHCCDAQVSWRGV